MPNDRTPILVGAAQYTHHRNQEPSPPLDFYLQVVRQAGEDTGTDALAAIDTIVAVGQVIDEPGFDHLPIGRFPNLAKSVSEGLNIPADKLHRTYAGGNTPQMVVNKVAEQIAKGEADAVLIVGGETFHSQMTRIYQGEDLSDWSDRQVPLSKDDIWGSSRPGTNEVEEAHGLRFPVNTYPMLENALRHHYGESHEEHMKKVGRFTSKMTEVAAANPYSWFPVARTPEEIITETPDNRMIGFPYTKYLNAVMRIDQYGAIIMTSVGKAKELGIPEDKWVYLHGSADTNEIWNVTERINFHSSPAIKKMSEVALKQAGKTVDDMDYFDLYSCFPAVVQIACDELGLSVDDPRGVTVTGGLAYFGGAGNAYVIMSIITMMRKLRENPGKFGMCTANGWYQTKHAMGIYSTTPFEGDWKRENPETYQAELDAMPHPEMDEAPAGRGTVEAYTVVHDKDSYRNGIVIGTLESGKRFVAFVPADVELMKRMEAEEFVGVSGTVSTGEQTNLFVPD